MGSFLSSVLWGGALSSVQVVVDSWYWLFKFSFAVLGSNIWGVPSVAAGQFAA